MKHESDFEARMLYDQSCKTEEDLLVYTAMFAVLWTYPGAMSKTSARIKLSSVYTYDSGNISIIAATIEKWRNEGWSMLDEFYDDRYQVNTVVDLRERLLNQAKSFLMGIPLEKIDTGYTPEDPMPDLGPEKTGKSHLSVLKFKNSVKDKSSSKDIVRNSDDTTGESSEDDDDFDFI